MPAFILRILDLLSYRQGYDDALVDAHSEMEIALVSGKSLRDVMATLRAIREKRAPRMRGEVPCRAQ